MYKATSFPQIAYLYPASLYKCGKDSQGHFFFDMEFVDGQTLSEKLFDLSEAEIIELMNSFFGKVISEKKLFQLQIIKLLSKKYWN